MHTENPTEKDVAQSLASINEGRAKTYALLSRLFAKEVDAELLESMAAIRFPLDSGNSKLDEGHRLIVGQLSTLWENSISELAIDYARVFLGGGIDGYSAAYPFESVYTSPRRLLMQDARDEVLALYRSEGLDKVEDWKEGEDHIALEFEYMQRLADRTRDALVDGNEDEAYRLTEIQRVFLCDHLTSWVPMLTSDMKRFAQTRLYQGLAFMVEGFLETDEAFLAAILDQPTDTL